MKIRPILLLSLVMAGCGGASKLKYAEKLYEEKAYKEAAALVADMPETDISAQLLLARSEYKMLHMEQAAAAFARVPADGLIETDKLMYAEALRQTGANEIAASVVANISAQSDYGLAAEGYKTVEAHTPYPGIKVDPMPMNTPNSELLPFYYQSGTFYMSDGAKKYSPAAKFRWNGLPYLQITTDGKDNPLGKLNSDFHDGPVTINETALKVIFNRNVPAKKKEGKDVIALFEKSTGKLQDKAAKKLPFCEEGSNYLHPYFNDAGTMLYYASDKFGGRGGFDIYYVTVNTDGTYGDPISLGENVNTPFDEVYPTMLSDSILVFSSNRTSGYGGLDLYSITMKPDGGWSAPRLLDLPVNSIRDDFYLIPSAEGDHQYLISSNRDGSDDIFNVTIPADAKGGWDVKLIDSKNGEALANTAAKIQYELSTVEGKTDTTDTNGKLDVSPLGGTMTLSVDGYKQAQASYQAPKHAFFTTKEEKIELNKIFKYDVNGKVLDATTGNGLSNATIVVTRGSQVDTIKTDDKGRFLQNITLDAADKDTTLKIEMFRDGYAPKVIEGVAINSGNTQVDLNAIADLTMSKINEGDELGALLSINSIYFELGKWDITPEGAVELDKIANLLLRNPSLLVECGSHTDCRGNKASNQDLSAKRAKSTVDYIMKKGVGEKQLRYKGYGEDRPVNDCRCEGAQATTCTEEELALNRRTEFRVLKSLVKDDQTVEEEVASTVKGDALQAGEEENQAETSANELKADNFEFSVNAVYNNESKFKQAIPAGKVFMVQIGAFTGEVDNSFFNGVTPIRVEPTDLGFTRYCAGFFTTYEKAEAAMIALQKKGFVDAFVVGFLNGKRVHVQEISKD